MAVDCGGLLLAPMLLGPLLVHLLLACGAQGSRARVARPFRQVRCTQGAARGYFAPRPPHYAFLGLPYASAPTPTHRFKAPEPPPSWDGIFEATHRIRCPQSGAGDENCLVVNVFTPVNATLLPVLVIVHDGDFQSGWGAYEPPEHLLTQGLVIITFNYRLGLLGFLCLSNSEAPGNAGLKDQVAALYWVQRNIASFGGNPSDVTVYGIGSGAIAIHLLLLSGLTEGLFHKVVLESGSALSPLSMTYEPVLEAVKIAVSLGYEGSEDLEELVEFFKKVPVKNLTDETEVFLPCIENNQDYDHSLLDWDPIEVLKKGSFHQVPILITYSSQDGKSLVQKNIEQFGDIPENLEALLPNNLKFPNGKTKKKIAEYVKEFYFNDMSNNAEQNYADYILDVLFEYPIIKAMVLYAAQSSMPVYMLKFAYRSKESPFAQDDVPQLKNKERMNDYIFANENLGEDEEVAEKLVTLLCNFIKLGDPTPITTLMIPIMWQPINGDSNGRLSIRTATELVFDNTLSMSSTATNQRLSFWDHVYKNFYRTQAPIHENFPLFT